MKIQCNVCEVAEANVLCCADEAALCWACDEKVHAANKLASKHQRVPLSSSSSQMPKCDICQETVGFFFCLEDRALLCRNCDVAIHTANSHVSGHQRFLLTGVKVGLEAVVPTASSSMGNLPSGEKTSDTERHSVRRRLTPISLAGEYKAVVPPSHISSPGEFSVSKVPYAGGPATGSLSQWQFDELIGLTEFNHNYGYMDNGSSKADSAKLGESDCSPILRAIEEELDSNECLGQVPEISWIVPQMPSPPTASGLYWPKTHQDLSDSTVFVPDICGSPAQHRIHPNGSIPKRRRHY